MTHVSWKHAGAMALMLAAAVAQSAAAQDPQSESQTSVVQRLVPDSGAWGTGATRELKCRGKPGIDLRIHQEPSPRDPRLVTMVLRYERPRETRAVSQEGMGLVDHGRSVEFHPGSCTWNSGGFPDVPPEPGVVYFDLPQDAQAWAAPAARDTTVEAAAHYPDVASLPRYLSDSSRYWVFYVDDASNISISFGRWPLGGAAPVIATTPAPAPAPTSSFGGTLRGGTSSGTTSASQRTSDATRLFRAAELRCRGGPALEFVAGARAGDNQVLMTLAYPVSPNVPGETGRGLAEGSCAWVDRTGLPAESGTVSFVTSGNAQLRQAQSGSTVDRSPTAAERWPDAHTIPAYMSDPGRFWRFSVVLADADSARQHGPWKPSLADAIAGAYSTDRATATAVTQAMPRDPAGEYSPGKAGQSTRVQQAFDIRNVQVTPGLEGVVIRFEAPADARPTVTINTAAPAGSAPMQTFSVGTPLQLVVSPSGARGMVRHTAASNRPLQRGTRYWFVITAPEASQSRLNQSSGDFRTLAQHFTLGLTDITIISDSDSDSNGDLKFAVRTCPVVPLTDSEALGGYDRPLDWTEGRHPLSVQLSAQIGPDPSELEIRSVPDRFRLVIVGMDNDDDGLADWGGGQPFSSFACDRSSPDVEPGSTAELEWNAITMDIDLTKYPGTGASEPFLRRSKPLRNGSDLMFEVRGYLTVERK